jgi:hypothetical protein
MIELNTIGTPTGECGQPADGGLLVPARRVVIVGGHLGAEAVGGSNSFGVKAMGPITDPAGVTRERFSHDVVLINKGTSIIVDVVLDGVTGPRLAGRTQPDAPPR